MYLSLVLLALFLIAAGLLWLQGLWSNVVTMINLILAGLLAVTFFEPLATQIDNQISDDYRYMTDFMCLWAVFTLSYLILRVITDQIAPSWVTFQAGVEQGGRAVMAVVNAYLLVGFIALTLHAAPIPPSPYDSLTGPDDPTMFVVSPDAHWLAFARYQSQNGLGGSGEFDSGGDYRNRQAKRRQEFEGYDSYLVN